MKPDRPILILREPDVVPGKQMLALGAKSHLAKRPPFLEWIALLKQLQLSARSRGEHSESRNLLCPEFADLPAERQHFAFQDFP